LTASSVREGLVVGMREIGRILVAAQKLFHEYNIYILIEKGPVIFEFLAKNQSDKHPLYSITGITLMTAKG